MIGLEAASELFCQMISCCLETVEEMELKFEVGWRLKRIRPGVRVAIDIDRSTHDVHTSAREEK